MMNRFILVVCKRQRYKVFYEANEPRRVRSFTKSGFTESLRATCCPSRLTVLSRISLRAECGLKFLQEESYIILGG